MKGTEETFDLTSSTLIQADESPAGAGSNNSPEALLETDHNMEEDSDGEFMVVEHKRKNTSTKRKRTNTCEDYVDGGLGHLTDMFISGNTGKANNDPNTNEGEQSKEPPLKKIKIKTNINDIGQGTSAARVYLDEGEPGEANPQPQVDPTLGARGTEVSKIQKLRKLFEPKDKRNSIKVQIDYTPTTTPHPPPHQHNNVRIKFKKSKINQLKTPQLTTP